MKYIKDFRFWLIAAGCVGAIILLWPISNNAYSRPYCPWLFNGISLAGFGAAWYLTWTRDWTRDSIGTMLWGLVLSSIPHLIFAVLSYGSWVCIAVAALIAVGLMHNQQNLTEHS